MTRINARFYFTQIILVLIVFLPSLMMEITSASSFSTGLLFSTLPIYFLLLSPFVQRITIKQIRHINSPILFLVFLFILIHYYFVGYWFSLPQSDSRFFFSLLAFMILLGASYILALSISNIDDVLAERIFLYLLMLLMMNGIMSLTGFAKIGNASVKPTFLFQEPSHFALVLAPFLIMYVRARLQGWFIFLLFFLIWSIYVKNLTMLLVVFLSCILGFYNKKIIFLLFFMCIIFLGVMKPAYFMERLHFSSDNNNLSVLVYLQGWQNAFLALVDTHFLGVGFQQLGIANQVGTITEKIELLYLGLRSNLFDGSVSANKLVAEFGVFSLFILFYLVVQSITSFFIIIKSNGKDLICLFAHCTMVSILIELFFRGAGYFSPGVFLYLLSFFLIRIKNSQKVQFKVFRDVT